MTKNKEELKKSTSHKGDKPKTRKPIRNKTTKKISELNNDDQLKIFPDRNDDKKISGKIVGINTHTGEIIVECNPKLTEGLTTNSNVKLVIEEE